MRISLSIPVAKKSLLRDLTNSWKAFSASCWLQKCFPAKSCWDAWRSSSQLVRGQWTWRMRQNFIARFIQFLKNWLCNMQSGIVVENRANALFCWPMPAAGIAVFSICLRFAKHPSQMYWFHQDSDQPHTTKQWPWPFLVQVYLWEVLWSCFLVQPLSWSSLVHFHHTSQSEWEWFIVVA